MSNESVDGGVAPDREAATDTDADADGPPTGARALHYVRVSQYVIASLVAFSVLVVGTVAVIAEVKGTWHWSIHLESTISYMGVFIGALLVGLVPLVAVSLAARVVYDA